MTKNKGYIKLHRVIQDNPVLTFRGNNLKYFFIELLLSADYKTGEINTSTRTLAKKTRNSLGNVVNMLKNLEENGMISVVPGTKFTTISIVNWSKFQSKNDDFEASPIVHFVNTSMNTSMNTSNSSQESYNEHFSEHNIAPPLNVLNNKEYKKDNISINRNIVPHSESDIAEKEKPPKKIKYNDDDIRLTEMLFAMMNNNTPNLKARKPKNSDYDMMRKIREIDERKIIEIEGVIAWSQNNDFWKNNIRSVGKLRDKFETLYIQAGSDYNQRYKGRIVEV